MMERGAKKVAERSTETRLLISVTGATGTGPTSLAAFDDCLRGAGVSNFNLVRLSSVIPPGSMVHPGAATPLDALATIDLTDGPSWTEPMPGGWGDRLFAVWAFQSAELLGQEAWAGVAWSQHPEDGRGLFVEHEGGSEAQVRAELSASLEFICEARGFHDLEQHSVVVGARCEDVPVGALVIAPFQTEPW